MMMPMLLTRCDYVLLMFSVLTVRKACGREGNTKGLLKPSVDVVFYERVVPLDGDGNRVARVSTREDSGLHSLTAVFQMETYGKTFTLDLELNRGLFTRNYKEVYFAPNGEKVVETHVDHCYYHGSVRGIPDSHVVLSTCQGLKGSFSYGTTPETHFYVEPLTEGSDEDGHLHAVYRSSDLKDANVTTTCGVGTTNHSFNSYHIVQEMRKKFSRIQRDVHTETKYIELLIVNDYRQFVKRGTVAATGERSKSVANFVDSVYKVLNTRVALVAVETWNNGDKISVVTTASMTLDNFLDYREKTLRSAYTHDIGELLTNIDFSGSTVGIAPVKGICSAARSGGINQDTGTSDSVGAIMAHEMGHNLGMEHDDGRGCTCTDTTNAGCIMEAVSGSTPPTIWSSCSVSDLRAALNDGVGACLFNAPTQLFGDPVCGNGFIESGEECDCGSTTECPLNDPCCTPGTCKLKSTSDCSTGECCSSCKFKSAGTVCRSSVNDCDLSESCVGNSKDCPENLYKQDGTSCDSNAAYCYDGQCNTHDKQCKYVWGNSASVANDVCYDSSNKRGDQYGHCGISASNKYIACSTSNVQCGLLQCEGGGNFPILGGSSRVGTITYSIGGQSYPCKGASVNLGSDVRDPGLVNDGTKCGTNKLCVSHVCTAISSLGIPACPTGSNGKICSGNGVCNNLNKCSCNVNHLPPTCASQTPAAIDGQWGSWGQWSSCSRTCDSGVRSRSRFCDNPAPSNGGQSCSGSSSGQQACNTQACPQVIDGGWSSWGSYSACSKTCGSGIKYRYRTCSNPAPLNGGMACSGNSYSYRNCKTQGCPVDGGWSMWSSWTSCTKSCGTGSRTRSRRCDNPSPLNGGSTCRDASTQQQTCNTQSCQAVTDGKWSQWSSWSTCSSSCGAGSQSRTRLCDSPPAQNGGRDCSGDPNESQTCQGTQCPRDGGWSEWQQWSDCSATCSGGQRVRTRSCTNPSPLHGGAVCPDADAIEESLCNTVDCDVPGIDFEGWSSWSSWFDCDSGNCLKSRSRTCVSALVSCAGDSLQEVDCTRAECAQSRNQTYTPAGSGGGGSNVGVIAGAVIAVLVIVIIVVVVVVYFVRKKASGSTNIQRPVYSEYSPASGGEGAGGYRVNDQYRPPPLHTSASKERLLDEQETTVQSFTGNSLYTPSPSAPRLYTSASQERLLDNEQETTAQKRRAPAPPVARPLYRPPEPPKKPLQPAPPPPAKPSPMVPKKPAVPSTRPAPPSKPSAVGSSSPQVKPKPAGAVALLPAVNPSQSQGLPKKALKPPKQWPPN